MIKTNDLIHKDINNETVTAENYGYKIITYALKNEKKKQSPKPIIKVNHKTRAHRIFSLEGLSFLLNVHVQIELTWDFLPPSPFTTPHRFLMN